MTSSQATNGLRGSPRDSAPRPSIEPLSPPSASVDATPEGPASSSPPKPASASNPSALKKPPLQVLEKEPPPGSGTEPSLEHSSIKTEPLDGQPPKDNKMEYSIDPHDRTDFPGPFDRARHDETGQILLDLSEPHLLSSQTLAEIQMSLGSLDPLNTVLQPPPSWAARFPHPDDAYPLENVNMAAMSHSNFHEYVANPIGVQSEFVQAHNLPITAATGHIESFARIEFADSVFQMTTYAVIIGRDQSALMQARQDERREQEYRRQVEENEAAGLPPPPRPSKSQGKFSKSYVSEEGGMLGPEPDANPRPAKRRRTSAGATPSLAYQQVDEAGRESALLEDSGLDTAGSRQYVSHTPGAIMVDLASLRPSPNEVPHIGIHSPGPDIATKTKAISRDHLRIEFNRQTSVFEAIPLHKNGFFINDVHCGDDGVVLRSGDKLQIKDVEFTFVIPGVSLGDTGAGGDEEEEDAPSSRRYSEGGKEMSFEFESSHADEGLETSEEEDSRDVDGEDGVVADEDEVMETVESDEHEAEAESPPGPEPIPLLPDNPPRKRGPGRPPKNGYMSKREERLRKKQAQEAAKAAMPQPTVGEEPVKRKVGRPRKHPLPENGDEKPEKRKYKPRKPKNAVEGETAADNPEAPAKPPKREKHKTPPLELNLADFTPEQLAKPSKNYHQLLDEIMEEAGRGLTLKSIYKRIAMKYPHFHFQTSKGWESSVRHNLISNEAFQKEEGTHEWHRNPNVDPEAGKKRKAVSPPPGQPASSRPSQVVQQGVHSAQGVHGVQGIHGVQGVHWNSQQVARARAPQEIMLHPDQPLYLAIPNNNQVSNAAPHPPNAPHAAVGSVFASQPAARPAFSTTPQVSMPAQAPGSSATVGPRLLQPGAPAGSYNSPYTAKLTNASALAANASPSAAGTYRPPHPAAPMPRPAAGAASSLTRPSGQTSGASPATGLQHVGTASVANGPRAALKPAVDPPSVEFIRGFKNQVVKQLENRCDGKGEAIAISVINRGIGLTTLVTAIDLTASEAGIEKAIFTVFEQAAAPKGPRGRLSLVDQKLVDMLKTFKTEWTDTLKARLSIEKVEALLLSVIDQGLGFTDKSIMRPSNDMEKSEFEEAERLLLPMLTGRVRRYQEEVANQATASNPAAVLHRPAPAQAAPARAVPTQVAPTQPAPTQAAPTQPAMNQAASAQAVSALPAPTPATSLPAGSTQTARTAN